MHRCRFYGPCRTALISLTHCVVLGFCVLFFVTNDVRGQTLPEAAPPATVVPPPAPVRSPVPESTPTVESSEESMRRFLPFSDLVFLLYKDLDKFQGPDWIIIPNNLWDQFVRNELAKRSGQRDGWAITDFTIRGKLEQPYTRAWLTVTFTVRAGNSTGESEFRPVEVDLQLGEAQCKEAKSSTGEIPSLSRDPGGPFRLTIDKPGVHTYELLLFVEIDRTPSEERLVLTLPKSGVKSVEITSAEDLLVARDGKTGRDLPLSADRKTILPDLRMEDSLNLSWRLAADNETGAAATHTVNGTLSYRIDESEIQTEAVLAVEARADVREWTFLVPPAERIRSVTVEHRGGTINPAYELVATNDDHSTLRVRFSEQVLNTLTLRIVSSRQRPAEGTPVEVGRWEMQHAEAQTGRIEVLTAADLRIRFTPKSALQRIAAAQLKQAPQRAQPLRAYRYSSQPALLELEIERERPILTASVVTDITVGIDSAEVRSNFRFSVRQAHTESLALRVAREMTDVQISPRELVAVESIRPNPQAGVTELSLSLEEPTIGDVNISLKGTLPFRPDGAQILRIPVPAAPIPADEIEYSGTVAVRAAPNVRLELLSEKTTNLRREPVPLLEDPQSEPLWFFRQMRGAADLAFTLQRLPRQIDAMVESKFVRTDTSITVVSTIRYRSKFEPMDEISLVVPSGVREVSVTGDKLATPGPAVGNAKYMLTNPVDRCEVVVEYQLPVTDLSAPELKIPLVLPKDVEITSFKGEVRCPPGLHAIAVPPWESGQPSLEADPGESGVPSLVVGSRNPPDHLTLGFERTGSLAALVVPRVLVEELPVADGGRQGKVRMLVSHYRSRAPILRMPVDCQLMTVTVNGQAAAYQPGGEGQWRIFLPAGNSPCALEIGYQSLSARVPGPFESQTVDIPRLEPDVALGSIRWLLQTSDDRLLMPASEQQYGDLDWRFRGYVPTPGSQATPATGISWLRAGDPALPWSPSILAEDAPAANYLQTWSFESRGVGRSLELYSVHKPFWILVCSGLVLVVGLGVSRSSPRRQLRLLVAFAGVAFAVWAVSPDWFNWLWFGGQWGLYLAVFAILLRTYVVRRRRLRYSIQPKSRNKESSFNSSSMVRRPPAQPAESVGQYGSTMDVN